MTNKERVTASMRHQQPDRVPYSLGFTEPAHAKMVAYYGDENFEQRYDECFLGLSTDAANTWKQVSDDIAEDDFGVQWDRSVDKDIGVVCNRPVTPETLDRYTFPDPDDPSRYATYDRQIRENPDQFVVAGIGFSLYERAWTLAGMETVLMGMIDNPGFIHELLDRICEYNLGIIRNVIRYDIDAMRFGDDWGQQTGLQMSPKQWREFIKPRLARMYGAVRDAGKFVMIHSCGKVDGVFEDLIEIGVDTFNPFQPEVMDVFEMKRLYGGRLCFHGGISVQRTLPFGTVEDVKREVKALLERVGEGGGYIASPSHAIPGDAKPENMAAMIDVLVSQ